MITAGVLSDTHLSAPHQSRYFNELAKIAFADCSVIFHAGDITSINLLDTFSEKEVYAVHGNMCDSQTSLSLPENLTVELEGYTISLCHGAGARHTIRERMWARFGEADCIIFGHTHQPLCEKHGDILFLNPGSFQCNSSYGSPASYALLQIDSSGITANLRTISPK